MEHVFVASATTEYEAGQCKRLQCECFGSMQRHARLVSEGNLPVCQVDQCTVDRCVWEPVVCERPARDGDLGNLSRGTPRDLTEADSTFRDLERALSSIHESEYLLGGVELSDRPL